MWYIFIYLQLFYIYLSYKVPCKKKKVSSVLNSPWSTLRLCRITALETDGPDGSCSVRPSALHLSSLGPVTPCTHSPLWFASALPTPHHPTTPVYDRLWPTMQGSVHPLLPWKQVNCAQGSEMKSWAFRHREQPVFAHRECREVWKKPENRRWVKHKRSVLHCFVNSESACTHRSHRWRLFGPLLARFKSLCVT